MRRGVRRPLDNHIASGGQAWRGCSGHQVRCTRLSAPLNWMLALGRMAGDRTRTNPGISFRYLRSPLSEPRRVSVEMVQKSAAIGAPVMVSVSAPTALAVRIADRAGITLAAIARADGFEVFTHPRRIWCVDVAGS